MTDTAFCDQCGVVLDLHNGPDSCDSAEMKADILSRLRALTHG